MAMQSTGSPEQVADIIRRVDNNFSSQRKDPTDTAETWLSVLCDQPLASIHHAFHTFVRDKKREFKPTSGVFLAVVDEHARRIRKKAETLKEAIHGENK